MFLDFPRKLKYEEIIKDIFPKNHRGWQLNYDEPEDLFFEKTVEDKIIQCWFKSRQEEYGEVFIFFVVHLYEGKKAPVCIDLPGYIEFGGVSNNSWVNVSLEQLAKFRGFIIHVLDYPFEGDFLKYLTGYDFGLGLCAF